MIITLPLKATFSRLTVTLNGASGFTYNVEVYESQDGVGWHSFILRNHRKLGPFLTVDDAIEGAVSAVEQYDATYRPRP